MNQDKYIKKIKRKYLILLTTGIILTSYGIIRYFFLEPKTGTNLITQLPTMIDGSISFALGVLLIIGGLHAITDRKRLAKEIEIEDNEKQKKTRKSPKWLKHY